MGQLSPHLIFGSTSFSPCIFPLLSPTKKPFLTFVFVLHCTVTSTAKSASYKPLPYIPVLLYRLPPPWAFVYFGLRKAHSDPSTDVFFGVLDPSPRSPQTRPSTMSNSPAFGAEVPLLPSPSTPNFGQMKFQFRQALSIHHFLRPSIVPQGDIAPAAKSTSARPLRLNQLFPHKPLLSLPRFAV